ncbi:MAG: tetratricopeptide repeat protein [Saprospiraceae bacterium]|nr:tetratricopeptide repeat protein [Saprospiraceae bacterium]
MAKKQPKSAPKPTTAPAPTVKLPTYAWMPWAAAAAVLLLFSTGFQNAMVAMDDHTATVNNPVVRDFSLAFQGVFNLGMFAPLTWWVYGMAYALGGDSPFWYHLFSALLHAANAWLVWHIGRRLGAAPWQALFLSLAFAIHPVQVEAVSWIAALSTPLFSFFLLLAVDAYLRYVDAGKWGRDYGLAVAFMLAGCLSKTAAVVLPLSLLAIDVWLRRPLNRNTLLEKAPFFALSFLFGLLTLFSRTSSGHTIDAGGAGFSVLDRCLMACHSVLFYWGKLLAPVGLSIWYPFERGASGSWPAAYYLAPMALAAILGAAWWYRRPAPVLWAGLLFYLSNIFLALPFYTIGEFELRSDRYNYLAALGVFAVLSALPQWAPVQQRKLAPAATVVLSLLLLVWAGLSIQRISDWRNTIALIDKAIAAQGDNFGKAYLWRGMAYGDQGKGKQALDDFNRAIERNPELYMAYKYRGALLGMAKQYERSVADLDIYLKKYPNDAEYLFNRGLSQLKLGKKAEAMADFNRAIESNPQFAPAYRSRAGLHSELGEPEKAAADMEAWERTRGKMGM